MTPVRPIVLRRPILERAYEAGLACNVGALVALRAEAGKDRRLDINRAWQRGVGAHLEANGCHLTPGDLSWMLHCMAQEALDRRKS